MSYVLEQFFQEPKTEIASDEGGTYLDLKKEFDAFDPKTVTDPEKYESAVIKNAKSAELKNVDLVDRVDIKKDYGVEGLGQMGFKDECIFLKDENSLEANQSYYFHGKIKRMTTEQVFTIYLVHKYTDNKTSLEQDAQYIKTVRVEPGDILEWVDVEFIFTPIKEFDGVLFELQRSATDYKIETRFAIIAYLELSLIKNIGIFEKIYPVKIGVVTRPGFLMCINNEEIRTSRTGVYELKNGVIVVEFFSSIDAAKESDEYAARWMEEVNNKIDVILDKQNVNPRYRNLLEQKKEERGSEKVSYYIYTSDVEVVKNKQYYTMKIVEEPTGNPSKNGYYEFYNNVYELTYDQIVVSGKTYYNPEEVPSSSLIPESDYDAEKEKSYILSAAFYGTSKIREIEPFTLDYMYNLNYEPKSEDDDTSSEEEGGDTPSSSENEGTNPSTEGDGENNSTSENNGENNSTSENNGEGEGGGN